MNEREIERLLKAYGDTVPPCAVPAPQRNPLRWPRFAAAGIATIAVAGIAVVGLWPRNAIAGSVARLHQALSNVKTMEYTISMKIPSGWHPVLRAFYENGAWRFDTRLGTNLEYSAVRRDGMQLTDYKKLDHATVDVAPPDTELSNAWQTALDFAKNSIDMGNTDTQRSLKILDHPPVNGRPAYEITMERPSNHYVAKILVDKETDLPIESSVIADDVRPGFGDVPQQIRTQFQFNKPFDPDTFSFDPKNRTVIRMKDAREQLGKMWQTPLASIEGAEVRAATVTRDGTIWIATTASSDKPVLPAAVTTLSGDQFVRGGDLSPGTQLDNKAFDDIFGKPIYVTALAPLPSYRPIVSGNILVTSGQTVTIQLAPRDPSYVCAGRLIDQDKGQREAVTVVATQEAGDLPSYCKLLELDRPNMSLVQGIWRAKAEALEASQQYRLAADAYGELAKARYNWVKYSAFQPMLDQARCYRLLGQTNESERLTQAAAVLKASRER